MTVLDYEPSSFTNGELNATPTRPASPAIPSNTFVKRVIDASSIEIGQKATYSEYKVVSDRHGDAANLIEANKTFIAEEAHARILLDYPGYTYYTGINPATGNPYTTAEAKAKCIDDIELALNKVAKDTAFGGNAETWDAAYYYDSGAVLDLANKKDETLTALNYAKDMAVQVMRKEDVFVFGTHGLTQVKTTSQLTNPIATKDGHALDPITSEVGDVVSDKGGDAQKLIAANKNLIAHEAVERMVLQSSTATFTPGNGTTYDASTGNLTIASVGHGLTGASTITATNAAYDPSTGVLTLTKNSHGMANGEKIQIVDESIWFKCTMDNKTSVKKYPRATDPVSGKWLTISNVQTSTFDVNVGKSLFVNFTPTAADYNPTTGLMTLTIGNHGLSAGTAIKLLPESLKFSCGFNGATGTSAEKSYPRASDPFHDTAINIESVTSTTITIQVLANTPSTNTDPHTFVSALSGAVISGGNYTHEIDQVASGGIKRANDSVRIDYDALTFTCGMDNDATEHKYPRISDPAASSILPISDTTNDTFVVNVGKTLSSTYDVSDASYNQTTGDLVLTINDHNLVKGSSIRLADGSLSFKCAKDAYNTPHSYPRATDPAYQTGLEITDVGSSYHSATDGSYDPGTGILNLTVAGHGFSNGNRVRIADHSLTFTCGMDGNATEHSYPRASDDASGKWLEISDVDNDSFSVNVGAAGATQEFTPGTLSTYDPVSGDLVLDIGSHTLATGEGIVIDDNALSFTCTMDGNDSEKTYPRPLLDQAASRTLPITSKTDSTITVNVGGAGTDKYFQPTAATYDQKTGDMTVTIGQHGLRVGSNITLKDNSLKFTCDRDNHQTTHSYPRVGTDPKAGKSIDIDEVGYITKTATNAVYTPSNGLIVITSSGHGFSNGDYVQIADNSLTFSCDLGTGDKQYPRPGFDYPSGRWLVVTNATNDTFSINVGTSSNSSVHSFEGAANNGIRKQDGTIKFNVGQTNITNYTPGNATTYDPNTGDLVLDIGTHSLQTGSRIKIADGAIRFTCTEGAGEHAYPRATDPASGKSLNIIATTSTTVTVNVLDTIPSTNVTVHTFVANSGVVNSITAGDDYEHTFVPGPENVDAVEYKPQSIHTFVTAVPNSVKQLPLSTHQFVRGSSNGVEKQSGTITINVGAAPNGADQFEHQFNAAGTLAGAVISGGDYTHTWIDAVADSVHKVFSVGGSNSYHNQDCVDDVNDLLDAIGHNVAYGGNDKTWDAAYSYKTGAHVAGEETETNVVFEYAKEMAAQVIRRQKVLCIGSHGYTQDYNPDGPITADIADPPVDRFGDARNLLESNKAFIAKEAYARMILNNAGFLPPTGNKQDCIDDIADFVTEIAYNVGFGGNDRTWDMANLYVTGAHVAGEEEQTLAAFKDATEIMVQVMRQEKVLTIGSHGLTQTYDPTISTQADAPLDNRVADAKNLILSNKNFVAEIALGRMTAQYPSYTYQVGYSSADCLDDLKDVVEVVAHNMAHGGNDRVWDAANMYVAGAHASGSENETIYSFNQVRDLIHQVMTNVDVTVGSYTSLTQIKDTSITNGVADGRCDSAKSSVTSLVQILTNTIGSSSSLAGVTRTQSVTRCEQVRSTINTLSGIVTNAISNPGSLAAITRTRSVGLCEDVRATLDTLFDIVKNTVASPSSLESVHRTLSNGPCQSVAGSATTLFSIITSTISNNGYLNGIERNATPKGLAFGPSVNADASTTNSYLFFSMDSGVYTSEYSPDSDSSFSSTAPNNQDQAYPKCATQATAIRQYFANISTIIQTGLDTVPRNEPSSASSDLSSRATIWNLDDPNTAGSNPHNLETGTPIRLVPRPRKDANGNIVDVDKRFVRLPNGFSPNTKYYVCLLYTSPSPRD